MYIILYFVRKLLIIVNLFYKCIEVSIVTREAYAIIVKIKLLYKYYKYKLL